MFTSVGAFIYKKIGKKFNKKKVKNYLRKVNVVSDEEIDRMCDKFYISLISYVLLIALATIGLCVIIVIKNYMDDDTVILERADYGGDEGNMELETQIDGETEYFDVTVLPLTYDDSSIDEAFEKGFEYLESVYLGENESADLVTSDLNLVDYIDELGLDVTWHVSEDEYINSKGEIIEGTLEEPIIVGLTAVLSYEDYQAEREFYVAVSGKEKSQNELIIESIKEYITKLQENAGDEAYVSVPTEVNGYSISAKEGVNKALIILFAGIFICVLIALKAYSDLRAKGEKRNDELLLAYPSFVDMLSLYMGAGLTVKGSLSRIALMSKDNFLTEEINFTLNEIQSGISETEAYYRLGYRLNIPVYMKITTLLSQNIKKGTRDILNMLEEEETAALQLKKELAKKKGEEAGTKLLFPMIVQLGIVMVVIVMPAFMSF